MNRHRLRYYLNQIGCDDERISTRQSANRHCSEALDTLGFSHEQTAQIEQSWQSRRARMIGSSMISVTFGAVTLSQSVYRYERAFTGLQAIINNWDQLSLAYSVIDTLGWENTAELVVTIGEHVVPIAKFVAENSGELQELANALGVGPEAAALTSDLIEHVFSLGVSILLSAAAWGFVTWMNSEAKKRLEEAEATSRPTRKLHLLLEAGALPGDVMKQLKLVPPIVGDVRSLGRGPSEGSIR